MDVKDVQIDKDAELNNEPVAVEPKDPAVLAMVEEMMRAGLFLGRKSSKTHPKMRSLVFGVRNGISMIDLEETINLLNKALDFIKTKAARGAILLVGTTPSAKKSVEEMAKQLGFPYVTERWLGGTLTNFKTLSKRVAYFKKLKSDKESGRLDKYTKKERLDFDREIKKLSVMFSGIEGMNSLPEVLFVVDANGNLTAVREARRLKIPVVAIANTDINPDLVDYLIPANDRNKSSIDWILARLAKVVLESKQEAPAEKV